MKIQDLFFSYFAARKWGRVNLNNYAIRYYPDTTVPNVLLHAKEQRQFIDRVHAEEHIDCSYGGFAEDRSHLWRGSYLPKDKMIHLGVDINVPAFLPVGCPVDSVVEDVFFNGDQQFGWGGRVILRPTSTELSHLLIIIGHLSKHVEAKLKKGKMVRWAKDTIDQTGEASENGGFFPHLHIQCISAAYYDSKAFDPHKLDGYGSMKDITDGLFLDPIRELAPETVKDTLNRFRSELKDKVESLVLCKNELYYMLKGGGSYQETVYPVRKATMEKEAAFFNCECSEQ